MNITIEGPGNRIYVGSRAHLVEGERLQAWAETHVRKDADIGWILGNFVECDRANDNGHIFPFADMPDALATIPGKPLNMLHHSNYIVGAYSAVDMAVPDGYTSDGVDPLQADGDRPTVEALSGFWRSFFPEEYAIVERANKDGALYYSMECLPETLTCPVADCGHTAKYAGKQHDSYCAHINASVVSPKRLDKPHFNAGALIIPPIRPGWSRADIKELSGLMKEHADVAERAYASLSQEFPHLGPREWESMMMFLVAEAWRDPALPVREVAVGLIPKDQTNYRASGTPSPTDTPEDDGDEKDEPTDACGNCSNGVFIVNDGGDTIGSMCQLVVGPIERDQVCDLHSDAPRSVRTETWVSYSDAEDSPGMARAGSLLDRSIPAAERKKMADKGHAMPDGSFPIENEADLKNAVKAVGRAKDPAEAKKHIKKRAKSLGKTEHVPSDW